MLVLSLGIEYSSIKFIKLIQKHLIIKADQATLGLEFQAKKSKGTRNPEWQNEYWEQMKLLNKR